MTQRDPAGWARSSYRRDIHLARVLRERCDHPGECVKSFGQPIQPWQTFYVRSRREASEQGAVLHAAERAAGGEG